MKPLKLRPLHQDLSLSLKDEPFSLHLGEPKCMTQKHIPNGPNGASELIDTRELAKRLKLCTRSVEKLASSGKISRIKIGKSVRFNWQRVVQELENSNSSAS